MDQIINTREDLNALEGTEAHDQFMQYLKGSMVRKQNEAIYPSDYGQPDYLGDVIEPIWVEVEDLSTIERFGFTKQDFT